MRLTSVGKFLLLILAVGFGVGGWKLWKRFGRPDADLHLPGIGGNQGTGGSGGGKGGKGVEIPFILTAAKADWGQEQIDRFNAAHGDRWRIVKNPIPSREAMHDILAGKQKPVLWSPGSPIWPARLAEVWQKEHGATIVDLSDPNGYRVFLRSPLVFLTTREKARFLRPLLGGPKGWDALRRLSMGRQKVPWGRFRFSHADPLTSSSGMLTLGLILTEYGQQTGQPGALDRVVASRAFIAYIKELERSMVYDEPAEKGTTALTKAFLENPSRYDLITAYESAALEAAPKNKDLAVIYPTPTAVSEHALSLLSASWVTAEQREGALQFLQFLGSKEALQAGLKYHFRPAQSGGALSLSGELSQFGAQGFQQTYSTAELPPYQTLNAAAFQWRVYVAHKPPTQKERG
jgi:hypothetical protein